MLLPRAVMRALCLFLLPSFLCLSVFAQEEPSSESIVLATSSEPLEVVDPRARFLRILDDRLSKRSLPSIGQDRRESNDLPTIDLKVRRPGDVTGTLVIVTSGGSIILPGIQLTGDGMAESLRLVEVLCHTSIEFEMAQKVERPTNEESRSRLKFPTNFFGELGLHLLHGALTFSFGSWMVSGIAGPGSLSVWIPAVSYFASPAILMATVYRNREHQAFPSPRQKALALSLHAGLSLSVSACAAGLSLLLP